MELSGGSWGRYNVQAEYGKDKVRVEVVVFGHGSGMLKFDSALAGRVDETLENGAQVLMCENTMKGQKLSQADMHPKIGYVKAGVIEIVEKSRQGWTVVQTADNYFQLRHVRRAQ